MGRITVPQAVVPYRECGPHPRHYLCLLQGPQAGEEEKGLREKERRGGLEMAGRDSEVTIYRRLSLARVKTAACGREWEVGYPAPGLV